MTCIIFQVGRNYTNSDLGNRETGKTIFWSTPCLKRRTEWKQIINMSQRMVDSEQAPADKQ